MELPIVLRKLDVMRTHDVTPRMRRITVAGDQLGSFESGGRTLPAFTTAGCDDYVKLFLAEPGHDPVLPEQHDGHLHWPKKPAPLARTYTVRRFDADAGELDLDFVLHGHGVAGNWARAARPGDVLHLAGPKISTVPPTGVDWWLLAGDDTALPAIARFVESAPGVPVHAAVLVESADEEQRDLPGVTWVHRQAGVPDARVLADAARSIAPDTGQAWMWIAGETGVVRELRSVAKTLGIGKPMLDASGYWRSPDTQRPLGRLLAMREEARESLDVRRRTRVPRTAD
ncbi:siderophore-interacting protein [Rhodococcus sp. HNM0569]|uniref:siderophore-interacting protein n=1 Tax=Rhodococcus sp. HNM0569 TaxID=2716340 RepID=UPI001F0D4F4B|nr:siderophore-interacting protein [Rhodococcus sp. HNM0569]